MPRKKTPIETSNPFGQKLNAVLHEKGIAGDYTALAKAFGVKAPSAREWVIKGRFAKSKFPRLVEWSGKSLAWWFDVPDIAPEAFTKAPPAEQTQAAEPCANLYVKSTEWPFKTVTPADCAALDDADRRDVEGYIRVTLWRAEQQRKRKPA